jgi:hypothetical protein
MRILSLLLLTFFSVFAQAEVLSFKSWKAERTEQAKQVLDRCQTELTAPPMAPPHSEARLHQAKQNLEVAQELNANDYFVLYLSQLPNETDFKEAAKKLTPDEVAEILTTVRKQNHSLDNGPDATLPLLAPTGTTASVAPIRRQ